MTSSSIDSVVSVGPEPSLVHFPVRFGDQGAFPRRRGIVSGDGEVHVDKMFRLVVYGHFGAFGISGPKMDYAYYDLKDLPEAEVSGALLCFPLGQESALIMEFGSEGEREALQEDMRRGLANVPQADDQLETKITTRLVEMATPSPFVAVAFLVLLVVAQLAQLSIGLPLWDPGQGDLLAKGALSVQRVYGGDWFHLFGPVLVQPGLLSFAFSVGAIFLIGTLTERLYGRSVFLFLVLATGGLASLTSVVFAPTAVSSGAGGVAVGLFAAFSIYGFVYQKGLFAGVRQGLIVSAVGLLAANFVLGLYRANSDFAFQVGGLISGGLLGLVMARPLVGDVRRRALPTVFVAGAVVSVVLAGGLIGIMRTQPAFRFWSVTGGLSTAEIEALGADIDRQFEWNKNLQRRLIEAFGRTPTKREIRLLIAQAGPDGMRRWNLLKGRLEALVNAVPNQQVPREEPVDFSVLNSPDLIARAGLTVETPAPSAEAVAATRKYLEGYQRAARESLFLAQIQRPIAGAPVFAQSAVLPLVRFDSGTSSDTQGLLIEEMRLYLDLMRGEVWRDRGGEGGVDPARAAVVLARREYLAELLGARLGLTTSETVGLLSPGFDRPGNVAAFVDWVNLNHPKKHVLSLAPAVGGAVLSGVLVRNGTVGNLGADYYRLDLARPSIVRLTQTPPGLIAAAIPGTRGMRPLLSSTAGGVLRMPTLPGGDGTEIGLLEDMMGSRRLSIVLPAGSHGLMLSMTPLQGQLRYEGVRVEIEPLNESADGGLPRLYSGRLEGGSDAGGADNLRLWIYVATPTRWSGYLARPGRDGRVTLAGVSGQMMSPTEVAITSAQRFVTQAGAFDVPGAGPFQLVGRRAGGVLSGDLLVQSGRVGAWRLTAVEGDPVELFEAVPAWGRGE